MEEVEGEDLHSKSRTFPDTRLISGTLGIKRRYPHPPSEHAEDTSQKQLFSSDEIDAIITEKFRNAMFSVDEDFLNIKLRSLVKQWSCSHNGKVDLKKMHNAINAKYKERSDEKSDGKNSSLYRRVKRHDVITEIKDLLSKKKLGRSVVTCDANLHLIQEAISAVFDTPGEDFINLVEIYLKTNEEVHVIWSTITLNDLKIKALNGRVVGASWVIRMCEHLINSS